MRFWRRKASVLRVRLTNWSRARLPAPPDAGPAKDWSFRLHERLHIVHAPMDRGYRMILDLDSPEQRAAFVDRDYEPAMMNRCFQLLPRDGVALDIGAHVGLVSCALGAHVKVAGGKVFGFEPVRANYERLLENVSLNGLENTVYVQRVALGAEKGELRMHVVPGSRTNNAVGENMLSEENRRNIAQNRPGNEVAPLVRLDDWAHEHPPDRCDLIKIDVEGAELKVFEGGRRLLQRFRPAILAEFNPYWMRQIHQSFEDVQAFLPASGLQHLPGKQGQLSASDRDRSGPRG